MTKHEYMKQLKHQLSYYEGDHSELLSNHDSIIDELLNEGLSMDDVLEKLGKPSVLTEDIAEEFNLKVTEQVRKETSLPSWAKLLLIVMILMIVIPVILSFVFGTIGTLLALVIGMVVFLFGGVFATASLWSVTGLTFGFKLLATVTSFAASISSLILTYFAIYWGIKVIKWLVRKFKESTKGDMSHEN